MKAKIKRIKDDINHKLSKTHSGKVSFLAFF